MDVKVIVFWSIGLVMGILLIQEFVIKSLKSEQSRRDSMITTAMMTIGWAVVALLVPTEDDTWLIIYFGVIVTLFFWNGVLVSLIVKIYPSLREQSQKESK